MDSHIKKVALCVSSFRAGGGEKQMVEIANALAARGYTIHLLVLKPVGPLERQVAQGVTIISLDAGRMVFSLPKLVGYLRREQPHVILATDEYTHIFSLLARILTRSKVRVVLRVGNMLTELFSHYEGYKNKVLPFFVRWLYKKADAVIANSRGVADEVVQVNGIDPAKVSVIFNPKPCAEILKKAREPAGHEWLDQKTLPVILAAGRLREQKNFPLLIRAFARVVAEIPCRLVIVGAGREESRLHALVRELELEQSVVLPGYSDNPYAFMHRADVYAATSLWEGLPNTLMEAMVCGTPVIAADCPSGPRELLAPDTDHRKRLATGLEQARYGILTAVNDEMALVEALRLMLSDPALRMRYGQASAERGKDFEAKDAIDRYMQVLNL